jgi:hypothetical protein
MFCLLLLYAAGSGERDLHLLTDKENPIPQPVFLDPCVHIASASRVIDNNIICI